MSINGTIFVDSNFGTPNGMINDLARPFDTINNAVRAAYASGIAGWVISIAPGEYVMDTNIPNGVYERFIFSGNVDEDIPVININVQGNNIGIAVDNCIFTQLQLVIRKVDLLPNSIGILLVGFLEIQYDVTIIVESSAGVPPTQILFVVISALDLLITNASTLINLPGFDVTYILQSNSAISAPGNTNLTNQIEFSKKTMSLVTIPLEVNASGGSIFVNFDDVVEIINQMVINGGENLDSVLDLFVTGITNTGFNLMETLFKEELETIPFYSFAVDSIKVAVKNKLKDGAVVVIDTIVENNPITQLVELSRSIYRNIIGSSYQTSTKLNTNHNFIINSTLVQTVTSVIESYDNINLTYGKSLNLITESTISTDTSNNFVKGSTLLTPSASAYNSNILKWNLPSTQRINNSIGTLSDKALQAKNTHLVSDAMYFETTMPKGSQLISGSSLYSVTTLDNDYTHTYFDGTYFLVNAGEDDITITIPPIQHGENDQEPWDGRVIHYKRIDNTDNKVIIKNKRGKIDNKRTCYCLENKFKCKKHYKLAKLKLLITYEGDAYIM